MYEQLRELIADQATTGLYVASAWARQGGIALLEDELVALRGRLPDDAVRGLFGIDLGGTTVEGLEAAVGCFGSVRLFHHPGKPPRTFHPKVYVVEQGERAVAFVGSANLTRGGMAGNFEATVRLEADRSAKADRDFLEQLAQWYDRLWNDPNATIAVSEAGLADFVAKASAWLPTEAQARAATRRGSSSSTRTKTGFSPFSPVTGLPPVPASPGKPPPPGAVVDDVAVDDTAAAAEPELEPGELITPVDDTDLRVLVALVPHDRWGQVGFSKVITEGFFRLFDNGNVAWVEGVRQSGATTPARETRLVNPAGSNDNHRVELREPDLRGDPKNQGQRGMVVVLERSLRTFRYMHLRPGDSAYALLADEIARRSPYGPGQAGKTKRVLMTYGELLEAWPGDCPLTA